MDGEPGRSNTLYLTAPSTEFARLAPVLGGLLGDLREQIHAWDIAGRRLGKPLLIVIDEAGQLELQWLPEEVSTIAGLGGMFVTGWQSKSQITHRYGTLADAVLGGHRSKVIFSGTDDPSTLDYVSRVAGTEHVAQRGWSADTGGGRKTVSEHVQREDLLPAHVIRQMRRQEAVLLHGTLPPIHLRLVRWWEDHDLGQLVPTGDDNKALPPPETGTCPVWPQGGTSPEPVLDPTVVAESIANLPRPRGDRPSTSGARHPRPARPTDRMQGQLDLAAALDEPVETEPGRWGLRALRSAGPRRGRCDGRLRRSDRDPLPPHLPVAGRVRGSRRRSGVTSGLTSGSSVRDRGSSRVTGMARQSQRISFETFADMAAHLDRWAAASLTAPAAWEDALVGAQSWLDYSARNQVLLASYGVDGPVAGVETWRLVPSTHEDRGCAVRAGEHGYPVRVPITTGGTEPDPYVGGSRPTRAAVERWEWRPVFAVDQLARRPAPDALIPVDLPAALSGPQADAEFLAAVRRVADRHRAGTPPQVRGPPPGAGRCRRTTATLSRSVPTWTLSCGSRQRGWSLTVSASPRPTRPPEYDPSGSKPRERWERLQDVLEPARKLTAGLGVIVGVDLVASPLPRMEVVDDRVVPAGRRHRLPAASLEQLPIGRWVTVGPYTPAEWTARGEHASGQGAYLRLNKTAYLVAVETGRPRRVAARGRRR